MGRGGFGKDDSKRCKTKRQVQRKQKQFEIVQERYMKHIDCGIGDVINGATAEN